MDDRTEPKLREAGIPTTKLKHGENQITCPQCSHKRKKKHIRCLSVLIDAEGFAAFCHHCGWSIGWKIGTRGFTRPQMVQRGARNKPGDFGAVARRQRYDVFS